MVLGTSAGVYVGEAFASGRGMVSSANAHLAAGDDRMIVIAPTPWSFGEVLGAAEDVAAPGETSEAWFFSPDQASLEAVGPNIYDLKRRAAAASASRAQDGELAGEVAATWG